MMLNISQKNAIEFIHGPCLILAGAGSGKTKVIIKKIIYLIKYGQYTPNNILAVTFTNKAAHEMKTRLLKYLHTFEAKKIMVLTFHALGLEIIKQEIHTLKFSSKFLLYDEKDKITILKKISKTIIKNNNIYLKKIIFMISYWKNKLLTPTQVQSLQSSDIDKNIAYIYHLYTLYLRNSNILDFDDLIYIPTLLLKKHPEIKRRWQKKIAYLLVDEYQDTNHSQYELIKMITENHGNFTLVGDDNQCIYSWRGANPKNILLLKQDFPNVKIIKMEHNYRSSGRILKAANNLIKNNTQLIKKKLFSQLKNGIKIKVFMGKTEENEVKKIAKYIFSKCTKNNKKYQDYAILYRSNYQSKILEKVLIDQNIPYKIADNLSFFSRSEIKDILNYLRVVVNPHDNHALMRILNIPARKIGIKTLNKLEEWANKQKISIFQSINDINIVNCIAKKTIHKIQKFISWMREITNFSLIQPYNLIKKILDDIKYETWLYKTLNDSEKIRNSMHNLYILSTWFQNMLKGSKTDEPMTLKQIIEKMTLGDITEKNIQTSNINKVQLMTLHASKGLEFQSVFIIGMIEGILPNHKSIHANHIEEERRLAYVGITRAQKELCLSYCYKYCQYGRIVHAEPSRFLFELPQEDLTWQQ
ncbi:MAG: UvrD-helicase domain-containing protein [Buchnera aphidicola (Pentalonia nigronervosa)]|uniref:DNA 3'-5' helicase n=1 Tax=Buchnera aphidicola (Pentalonia nigronervosa) TaxID=1309793 RepID=A0A7H1AZ45_9GAMM|nr:MAG: UvrD-helicase domain-containing protein [Buchnera aphidicola (Pentalonia nigronervosa)]